MIDPRWKIYKFKDGLQGFTAFIYAKDYQSAYDKLVTQTSIPFELVGEKFPEELNQGAIILRNDILPF